MVLKSGKFDMASETERLILRPLEEKDYQRWIEGFQHKLPSQSKYDEDQMDMSEWTQESFNEVVKKLQNLALTDKAFVFGIFLKNDNKHIGKVEVSTIMRDEFQWGLLGYRLHNQFWGKGYGKEAVSEALKMAFNNLDFHRIEAHINVDNIPSIKLAENAGMEYECTRKGFIYEFEEWTDNLIYYKNAE